MLADYQRVILGAPRGATLCPMKLAAEDSLGCCESDVEETDCSIKRPRRWSGQQEPSYWSSLHRSCRWSGLRSSRRGWMETSRDTSSYDVWLLYAYSASQVISTRPSVAMAPPAAGQLFVLRPSDFERFMEVNPEARTMMKQASRG
jgi:hypothetical protein